MADRTAFADRGDTAAVHAAAERHAYALLIRSEGWRLYMAHQLRTLWNMEKGETNPELTEPMRLMLLGRKHQMHADIAYVYQQAAEESPLELERKAIQERLVATMFMPAPAMPSHEDDDVPATASSPRSQKRYAGGVA